MEAIGLAVRDGVLEVANDDTGGVQLLLSGIDADVSAALVIGEGDSAGTGRFLVIDFSMDADIDPGPAPPDAAPVIGFWIAGDEHGAWRYRVVAPAILFDTVRPGIVAGLVAHLIRRAGDVIASTLS